MSDPRKIARSDAIDMLWPLGGPYSADQVVSAGAAIDQLSRYLAHAVRLDVTETLFYPNDSTLLIDRLRSGIDSLGIVLGQMHGRAVDLADDPALRHDRNRSRAAATATDAGAALFSAMTLLPPVQLNLARAAERLGHLFLDRSVDSEEGAQS